MKPKKNDKNNWAVKALIGLVAISCTFGGRISCLIKLKICTEKELSASIGNKRFFPKRVTSLRPKNKKIKERPKKEYIQ